MLVTVILGAYRLIEWNPINSNKFQSATQIPALSGRDTVPGSFGKCSPIENVRTTLRMQDSDLKREANKVRTQKFQRD